MAAAAVASAVTLLMGAGAGDASALTVDPSKFGHTASLTAGVLSVAVTNSTARSVRCQLSVHREADSTQLTTTVDAVNAELARTVLTAAGAANLAALRSSVAAGALATLWTDKTIEASATSSASWNSGRTDSSYVIYQDCASTDSLLGLPTGVGAAQAYTVTGTGEPVDAPGSTGSLGSLIPGL
ncbi:hypothetical protein IA539_19160 [Gordonia sp. zg691]|uniref:hypothetical protein n=1 Tax=Gordonia jinghuaiqii TaxID=2758710 RepID=UPI00166237E4|nr:hypothetical protein [Gordonia jinghuaiqii]MBD0863295.1 hypothetical protein [Gordonia jinghuaiqii]